MASRSSNHLHQRHLEKTWRKVSQRLPMQRMNWLLLLPPHKKTKSSRIQREVYALGSLRLAGFGACGGRLGI